MPDLADLYPGYASRWIDTAAGKIFARVGGSGPPLLLLHGHPQSNVMWHRVAPALAARFTLVIAALGLGGAEAKTLHWANRGDPQTTDPHSQNEGLTNNINFLVYEFLIGRDKNTRRVCGIHRE